jgi:choice-of-anchor B domain-containing protein
MRARSHGILVALALALSASSSSAQLDGSRNMTFLANRNDYTGPLSPLQSRYSSCWSYVHGDGREYALIGTFQGTFIYNVTNPANPVLVASIPGPQETHREMKSYRNWVYIVTEGAALPNPGVQIIRMTNPDSPVLVGTYTATFNRAHTVTVDTSRALLICNGTRNASGQESGVRILSLANPESPVEVGRWPGGALPVPDSLYVHDTSVQGNRLHASSFDAGIHRVLDITNPAAPTQIAFWPTGGGTFAAHSSWPDASGNYLYECDEKGNLPMHVFNISNLSAVQKVFDYVAEPEDVGNNQHVVHNPRVKGNELYLSCYIEGTRVLDISDPAHPAEFAWADSYIGTAPAWWYSVWEVCPYFPSGIVIASDMQTGLYVYQPVRTYGIVRVLVVAEGTGTPLPGASVYLTSQGDSLGTGADGIVQFGPSPGLHNVVATKSGYLADSKQVLVKDDSVSAVTLILPPGGGGGGGGGGCGRCPVYVDQSAGRNTLLETRGFERVAFRAPTPNPLSDRVRLTLEIPVEQEIRVEVLDVSGRRMITLYGGTVAAGLLVLNWDGRTEAGHMTTPGIYFARAIGREERATVRFVRVP